MQHQSQALLATILATAVDAIIVIDKWGTIQVVNDSTLRMFGYAKDELIRHNVKMLMPSPDHEQHDGYLRNYMDTGQAQIIGIGREVLARRKDGSTFPVHLSVNEVGTPDGRLFAGILHDITALKQTQQRLASLNDQLEEQVRERTEQLRAAQSDLVKAEKLATLGQVAGGIAHEIRNPLSVIRTSTFFLKRAKNAPDAKVKEHLERIERQVSLVDNVVTALADVARLPEPKVCECDIGSVIADVLQATNLPPEISVERFLPADLPAAKIDPNQVAIVFRNLFQNARDAMPDGGTLWVRAQCQESSRQESSLTVNVRDSGAGIAAENLERILEPLYSTKARGMGLGLAICVAILEKNGGRLGVQSELGVGTTFEVHLPLFHQDA